MTWQYRIAKKTINDKVMYSLVEAYSNDEGGIWGYTDHVDPFCYIQDDDFDSDDDLIESLTTTLAHLISDIARDFIDVDNFVAAPSGFEQEIEAIKSDN